MSAATAKKSEDIRRPVQWDKTGTVSSRVNLRLLSLR
jgi:hypothetical protein